LQELEMRFTYRTVRTLMCIAKTPGASNREIGLAAGISDQGQASKLLARLKRLGLVENGGDGHSKGAPNAWTLSSKGMQVQQALSQGAWTSVD
jgi:chromosome segregation and condensation protein ScpB